MASARVVASNENVQTYGDGTRDFTDLNTWEAATDIDLVAAAQSEVLECFDDAASFDDDIAVAGATTNASFFRIIRPASGQGHDGTPNNGFFIDSTIADHTFRITEDFFSLQDIIIRHIFSSSDEFNVTMRGDNSTCVGVICFDSVNNGAGGANHFNSFNGVDVVFVDCIGINPDEHNFRLNPGGGITTYVYNCTVIDAGSNGVRAESGTIVAKNVLSTGNTTGDFVTAGGVFTGSVTNASGDASAPGSTPRINQTFTFVNAASDDYHLAAGDAGAKDFGTDLSADAVFAFDDDIDGDLFGTWDIGFDEPTVVVAVTSDAIVNYASQVGLQKDVVVNEETLLTVLKDEGPSAESLITVTEDDGPNIEALQTIQADRVVNFETLISVLQDASPPFESLVGILKDAGINLESLQGIAADRGINYEALAVVTSDRIANFESLVSVLKDAVPNFESLLGVLKDAGVNILAQGFIASDKGINYETLMGAQETTGVNFESLLGVLKDAGVNILAEGFITSDKGINYETLISVQETTGVNFESLITVSQQVDPNFESLITASRDLAPNFESLRTVFQDAVAVYETLIQLQNDITANIEALIGVQQDEGVNLESLGTVTQDAVANLEALGTATEFAIVNISTFLVIAAKLLLDCPLSDILTVTCELEDTLAIDCPLTEDES